MKRIGKSLRRIIVSLGLGGLLLCGVGCNDSSNNAKSNRPQARDSQVLSPRESGTSDTTAEATNSGSPDPSSHKSPANPNVAPLGRTAPGLPTAKIPQVLLTEHHAALCAVKTSDPMPEIELPNLAGESTSLKSLYGEKLTVVCFWKGDRALARWQLADLGPDVAAEYSGLGVKVVAVAVEETPESASKYANDASVTFPVLVDTDGKAFALVGAEKLPRTYLLDSEGNILWFDIEYSRSTRRELRAAIQSLVGKG